jgi:hypothetical protein
MVAPQKSGKPRVTDFRSTGIYSTRSTLIGCFLRKGHSQLDDDV